jgi:hypothetical protein
MTVVLLLTGVTVDDWATIVDECILTRLAVAGLVWRCGITRGGRTLL